MMPYTDTEYYYRDGEFTYLFLLRIVFNPNRTIVLKKLLLGAEKITTTEFYLQRYEESHRNLRPLVQLSKQFIQQVLYLKKRQVMIELP